MHYIVISCIGPDKKGIVESLSQIISQYKGNWQTSSLHHLSGFFAGVIEIAVNENVSSQLISALQKIEGLHCQIELAKPDTSSVKTNLILDLTANDRAGIVQEVSSVIHDQQGNLIKLVSSQYSAAHTGQLMFKAKVQISINEKYIDDLISALEYIADDLMVDISRD